MKVIRSVRTPNGTVIQKQPDAGMGQQRCMKCQNLCTLQRLPNGMQVMLCSGCGATHQGRPMDKSHAAKPGAVPRRPKK